MINSKLPTIDIITPVYNRSKYLRSLYFSIAQHKIIRNWIVIDHGSDDRPEDIISSLPKNPSLQILFKKIDKVGFNGALNVGFSYLASDYFLKVDSDDLLMHDFDICFEKVYRVLEQQNIISSIYGFSFRSSDPNGNLIGVLNAPDISRISSSPPIYLCKYSYMRVYSKWSYGDLLDVFESSFVRHQFRYPKFGDERISPTSSLHTSCALHHSEKYIAYVNVPLLIKNYLPGGMTHTKISDLKKNPKAYLILALQHSSFLTISTHAKISILKTIIRALFYIGISLIAKLFR